MLWRQSWRPHQRKQHIGSRYARDRMLRRGLGLRHDQKAHSGTYEAHQRPSVGLRWGRRTRDNHRVLENLSKIPKRSAAGVDGQTVEAAKESFEGWIEPVLQSIHRQGYRAPNIRRV